MLLSTPIQIRARPDRPANPITQSAKAIKRCQRQLDSVTHGPLVPIPMRLFKMTEKIDLDAKERLCCSISRQVRPGHQSVATAAPFLVSGGVGQSPSFSRVGVLDRAQETIQFAADTQPSPLFGLLCSIYSQDAVPLPPFACTMNKLLSGH